MEWLGQVWENNPDDVTKMSWIISDGLWTLVLQTAALKTEGSSMEVIVFVMENVVSDIVRAWPIVETELEDTNLCCIHFYSSSSSCESHIL